MKRFNLMPNDSAAVYANAPIRDSYRSSGKDKSLIIISLPIIIALALVYFMGTQEKPQVPDEALATHIEKLESLKKEHDLIVAESMDRQKQSYLIEERNKLQNNLDTIKSLSMAKSIPLDILVAIGRNISDKLALTGISKKDDTVEIEGLARDNKSLSDFMDVLENQMVFKKVSVKKTQYTDEYGPYKQNFKIIGGL
jgi:Tfp pilus assembly protein PilN